MAVENRGRDVAPWLVSTKQFQDNYTLFCHIHAKESFQYGPGEGDRWRRYLFDNLIDREASQDIIWMFQQDDTLGCVFSAIYKTISDIHRNFHIPVDGEFNEKSIINELLKKMGYNFEYCRSDNLFCMGTMMWYRPKALKPLFDLNLKYSDFPPEPVGVGGTIAHAIERLPAFVARTNGYRVIVFNETDIGTDKEKQYLSMPLRNDTPYGIKGAIGIFLKKKLPPRIAQFFIKVFHLC